MRRLRRALRPVTAVAGAALRAWRRSLQLRVAATTALISGVVVVIIGIVVLDQISGKLLEGKQRAALAEADNGLRVAHEQLGTVSDSSQASVRNALNQLVQSLSGKGSNAGVFDVVIVPQDPDLAPVVSGSVDPGSVSTSLRQEVDRVQRAYQYSPVRDGTRTQGGLIVGERALTEVGNFDIFYLFSMDSERQTLALVQRTIALSGLVLVLLVAAIAVIVTRQVVAPVRQAARIASRLSAGQLAERMQVRGTDDLARLATSFNGMAASMQRQITELEELSWLQRRFTSDVSHELRTPLTTVRMAADVLYAARDRLPEGLDRSSELLYAELGRFETLLTDLLEISRHDAGAVVLEAEATDMCAVVRDVVDAMDVLAARSGSELRTRIPRAPVIAEMDPRRIARIMRNLLANAIEHGAGLPVDVTLAGDEQTVTVTVRDFGIGLRPGEAERVFDRFWRADPSRTRRTGGSGLGLAISLEDARLHHGTLDAWGGEPGQGTLFRLTIPAVTDVPMGEPLLPVIPGDSAGSGSAGSGSAGSGSAAAGSAAAVVSAVGSGSGSASGSGPRPADDAAEIAGTPTSPAGRQSVPRVSTEVPATPAMSPLPADAAAADDSADAGPVPSEAATHPTHRTGRR